MPLPEIPPMALGEWLLRAVQPADLPDLHAIHSDSEVTRYLPFAAWQSDADAQAWLDRTRRAVDAGTARQLVLVDGLQRRVAGTVLLFRFDAGSARAELGYVLGRPWWGQGAMARALRGLIDHAFGALALRRLEAEVDPRNLASNALLRRLGFTHEGLARERWVNHGVPCDMNRYGLLARDRVTASHPPG